MEMIQRFYDRMKWWSIPRISDLLVQILTPLGLGEGGGELLNLILVKFQLITNRLLTKS